MCDPNEIKPETIPGLPEDLPPGERVLWRGSPNWKSLALHVFHVRAVAVYFVGLMAWKFVGALSGGQGAGEAVAAVLTLAPMALAALGLLALFGWLIARSTIYTITNERVVIRAGVALPKTINIPFSVIGSAGLRTRSDGNGDIPLQLSGPDQAAYLGLWPHVRPWKLYRAEPMLRGVPDVAECAGVLAGALAAKAGQPSPRIAVQTKAEAPSDVMAGRTAAAGT